MGSGYCVVICREADHCVEKWLVVQAEINQSLADKSIRLLVQKIVLVIDPFLVIIQEKAQVVSQSINLGETEDIP
jgi:hypothetical protein